MRAGATIHELNTVRKHLSRLKGGGLARAAAPARVVVPGPLRRRGRRPLHHRLRAHRARTPRPTRDALDVLRRARRAEGAARRPSARHLEAGRARRRSPETPKPGDPLFARVTTRDRRQQPAERGGRGARGAPAGPAAAACSPRAWKARRARPRASWWPCCASAWRRAGPRAPPVCLLAGGETTVTVRGRRPRRAEPGDGGGRGRSRSARFPAHAVVASLATDGVDGASDAAGGVVDQETRARGRARLGLAPPGRLPGRQRLHELPRPRSADLIVTGPTGHQRGGPHRAARRRRPARAAGVTRADGYTRRNAQLVEGRWPGRPSGGTRGRGAELAEAADDEAETRRAAVPEPRGRRRRPSRPRPRSDAAEAFHQRARLAEDRLAEVLAAYRKLKTRERGASRAHHQATSSGKFTSSATRGCCSSSSTSSTTSTARWRRPRPATRGQPLIEGLILVRTQLAADAEGGRAGAHPGARPALRPPRQRGGGHHARDRPRPPPPRDEGAAARLPHQRPRRPPLAGRGRRVARRTRAARARPTRRWTRSWPARRGGRPQAAGRGLKPVHFDPVNRSSRASQHQPSPSRSPPPPPC